MKLDALPPDHPLKFPPHDLMRALVEKCFQDAIPHLPVLHRPTFMQQLAEERHKHDNDFARLLLVVCAVGARYHKSRRVCLSTAAGEVEWGSAGWVYFVQVHQVQRK